MKKPSIDLGLAVSGLNSIYGVPKTHQEIAAYCDCTWQAIYRIEQKALRRLRNKYLFHKDPDLREAAESLLKR